MYPRHRIWKYIKIVAFVLSKKHKKNANKDTMNTQQDIPSAVDRPILERYDVCFCSCDGFIEDNWAFVLCITTRYSL